MFRMLLVNERCFSIGCWKEAEKFFSTIEFAIEHGRKLTFMQFSMLQLQETIDQSKVIGILNLIFLLNASTNPSIRNDDAWSMNRSMKNDWSIENR